MGTEEMELLNFLWIAAIRTCGLCTQPLLYYIQLNKLGWKPNICGVRWIVAAGPPGAAFAIPNTLLFS